MYSGSFDWILIIQNKSHNKYDCVLFCFFDVLYIFSFVLTINVNAEAKREWCDCSAKQRKKSPNHRRQLSSYPINDFERTSGMLSSRDAREPYYENWLQSHDTFKHERMRSTVFVRIWRLTRSRTNIYVYSKILVYFPLWPKMRREKTYFRRLPTSSQLFRRRSTKIDGFVIDIETQMKYFGEATKNAERSWEIEKKSCAIEIQNEKQVHSKSEAKYCTRYSSSSVQRWPCNCI